MASEKATSGRYVDKSGCARGWRNDPEKAWATRWANRHAQADRWRARLKERHLSNEERAELKQRVEEYEMAWKTSTTYKRHLEDRKPDARYKGRNALVCVVAGRFTDSERDEVMAALGKLSDEAKAQGGTAYLQNDIIRAAVLDFARWVNGIKRKGNLAEALEVMEDGLRLK